MVDQPARNCLIGLGNQSHSGSSILKVIDNIRNCLPESLMIPMMVLIVGIAVLPLQSFLVAEVTGDVITQEFQCIRNLCTALTFTACQKQAVDGINQFMVFPVNQTVAGLQIRCPVIGFDPGRIR